MGWDAKRFQEGAIVTWNVVTLCGTAVGQWELFNLHQDPEEVTNLNGRPESRETVTALPAELDRLRRELGDRAPAGDWIK